MIFETLYTNYDATVIGLTISKYASGFLLEGTELPYISLQGVSHVVQDRYSCMEQLEVCQVNFLVYAESRSEIKSVFRGLRSTYVKRIDGFDKVLYGGSNIREVLPQIWFGTLGLIIYYQRTFSPVTASIDAATTFEEAIYDRWVTAAVGVDFYTSAFVPENQTLPYAVIPNIPFDDDLGTTCSEIESSEFNIQLFDETLTDVESKLDDVINTYHGSAITCTDVDINSILHTGHRYIEIEPQLWRGEVTFEMTLENANA